MKKIILSIFLLNGLTAFCQDEEPITINNSAIAFTVSEKDLLPENIAYDPKTESFFIGSTRKGKVIKISKSGKETDFLNPKQDGLFMIIGMKVDAANRWLWVCSSGGGNLINYSLKDDKEGRPAGVFKFNLDTGKLIKKYMLNAQGEVHFFNDLVVDNQGNVYITHMFKEHAVYTIQKGKDELELFVKPPELVFPNGITISDNQKYLFVAHRHGIMRIEIATKNVGSLKNEKNFGISNKQSFDGIYFKNNSLIGVQAGVNTVKALVLNKQQDAVVDEALLEVNHPMMNNPTTGVLVHNEFYYVANAQFGSFDKDGNLFPMEKLYQPTILKVNLKN